MKVVPQTLGHSWATVTLDTHGHLFDDRLDEVGAAMDAARTAARACREATVRCPVLPRVLPEPDFGGNEEEALISVSAGQSPFSVLYPRPDSNRRYRLERAAC